MSPDPAMLSARDATGAPLSDPVNHADRIDHYLDMSQSPPERIEVETPAAPKAAKTPAKKPAKKAATAPAKKASKRAVKTVSKKTR